MNRALALVTLGILLSGCGQKGPLYLPEEPAKLQTSVEQHKANVPSSMVVAQADTSTHGGVGG